MTRCLLTMGLMSVLATLAAGGVFRDTLHESTQEGRRLYDAKKYAEALAAYGRGRAEEPDHPVLAFNVGDTLLAMGKTDEALTEYRKALTTQDSGLKARTFYNIGNAYLQKQDLSRAIDAYRQSLLLDSAQKDAKRNLELALRKQKEQQEQQQQSKNDKNQKDKDRQDKNQQGQNQPGKNQQGKDQQGKDQQGKDQQGKNQSGKDQQAKEQQAKEQQAKEQQAKEQTGGKQDQRDARQQQARPGQQDKAARMDKAQALQLLQALSDQERAELFQLLQQKRKTTRKEGKDW
jgi:Ca-activated chloride channel family protein